MCVVATEMLQYNTDHLVITKEVYSQISTDLLTILDKIGTNLPFTLLDKEPFRSYIRSF